MIVVYDVSKIVFVSKELAEHYIIDSKNIVGMIFSLLFYFTFVIK